MYFTERSATCKEMVVDLISSESSFSHKESSIKLTLDLKSYEAQSVGTFPIKQGIEKLLISLCLAESLLWIVTLHCLVNAQFHALQGFFY